MPRQHGKPLRLLSLSSDPAGASAPDLYWNTATKTVRRFDGARWLSLREAQINLVKNPSAEVNATDGGMAAVNTAVTQTFDTAHGIGYASWKLQALAAGDVILFNANDRCPAEAGHVYSFGVWIKTAATSRNTYVFVQFFNAAGTVLDTLSSGATADLTTRFLQSRLENVTAPATTASVAILAYVQGCALGEIHYADEFLVVEGATLPGYFDGDSPGCSWAGARHNSFSTS